jgi:hypothetical protein
MKFKEAQEKLKEVSGGKFRTIGIEIQTDDNGKVKTTCSLYVGNSDWITAGSFEGAFKKLSENIVANTVGEMGDDNE